MYVKVAGQSLGTVHAEMKSFSERNPLILGAVGIVAVAGIVLAALEYQKLPFFNQGRKRLRLFRRRRRPEGPATPSRSPVIRWERCPASNLTGLACWSQFKVGGNVRLGDRTEAAIKSKGLLGSKILDVTPRGEGQLDGAIPIEQDDVALPAARCAWRLGHHDQRAEHRPAVRSLATLAQTFANTPPDLKNAVQGVARFAQTLDDRDAQLRNLLDNAAKATGVLAKRTDQVVSLVQRHQRAAGAAADAKRRLGSDLGEYLRGVAATDRGSSPKTASSCGRRWTSSTGYWRSSTTARSACSRSITLLNTYAMSLGEVGSVRPVLQGIRGEPAAGSVRSAVHRRRILRPGTGPGHIAAVAADRPANRPARRPRRCRCRTRGRARAARRG